MAAGAGPGVGGAAERHKRKTHLALGIDVEQAIHGVVYESADYLGGQAQRSADGQEVGQQGAVVPAEVAVGAVLILPGVAPVGGGADDCQRGVGDGGLGGRGIDQDAAIVSGAKPAQAELGGGEVIDAGFEVARDLRRPGRVRSRRALQCRRRRESKFRRRDIFGAG